MGQKRWTITGTLIERRNLRKRFCSSESVVQTHRCSWGIYRAFLVQAQKLKKDYDVTAVSDRNRNQHLATYKTIGFDKPTIPISTTKEGLEQTFKQKRFHEPLSKTTVIRIFGKMGLELCFQIGNGRLDWLSVAGAELLARRKRVRHDQSWAQVHPLARSAGAST